MVRDSLGIRVYCSSEEIFVYLDLAKEYYSLSSKELVAISDGDKIAEEEQLVGPQAMVLWSDE